MNDNINKLIVSKYEPKLPKYETQVLLVIANYWNLLYS